MDLNKTAEGLLSPQSFIELLIQFASYKYRSSIDSVPNQFSFLIENHLIPRGAQENDSTFHALAYDHDVRAVLAQHSEELQLIFKIYAEADTSTVEASQRANTMNILEFQMLLTHCEMLDEVLTASAVNEIFERIQQDATDSSDAQLALTPIVRDGEDVNNNEGIADDDELAFSEFLDGIVAITAYKEPNPFTDFADRLDTFIMNMFGELRRHWSRKRDTKHVDGLLNALQKKLKLAQAQVDPPLSPKKGHLLFGNMSDGVSLLSPAGIAGSRRPSAQSAAPSRKTSAAGQEKFGKTASVSMQKQSSRIGGSRLISPGQPQKTPEKKMSAAPQDRSSRKMSSRAILDKMMVVNTQKANASAAVSRRASSSRRPSQDGTQAMPFVGAKSLEQALAKLQPQAGWQENENTEPS